MFSIFMLLAYAFECFPIFFTQSINFSLFCFCMVKLFSLGISCSFSCLLIGRTPIGLLTWNRTRFRFMKIIILWNYDSVVDTVYLNCSTYGSCSVSLDDLCSKPPSNIDNLALRVRLTTSKARLVGLLESYQTLQRTYNSAENSRSFWNLRVDQFNHILKKKSQRNDYTIACHW